MQSRKSLKLLEFLVSESILSSCCYAEFCDIEMIFLEGGIDIWRDALAQEVANLWVFLCAEMFNRCQQIRFLWFLESKEGSDCKCNKEEDGYEDLFFGKRHCIVRKVK